MNKLEELTTSSALKDSEQTGFNNNLFYFDEPEHLLSKIEKLVKETEVVADIGCGIAPMNYFYPALHFMIDPWQEYTDILSYRYIDNKSAIVLRATALDALRTFGDNSIDSIFLIDVIEHMEKEEGYAVIKESERVARQQIVLFTPLGFMSQEMEVDEKDAWGLSGTTVQTHKSGWMPEDFSSDWSFYICDTFHKADHKGNVLEKPHGAFFAIKNIEEKVISSPKILSNIRRPTKGEADAAKLRIEVQELQAEHAALQAEHDTLRVAKGFQEADEVLQQAYHKSELKIAKLRAEYEALEVEKNLFQTEVGLIQTDHNLLLSLMASLQAEHHSLQAENAALQSEHAALQSEHNLLQIDHASLQEEYKKMSGLPAIRAVKYLMNIGRGSKSTSLCQDTKD